MLGSVAEAEDVTQEALLRLHERRPTSRTPPAFLTTVTTRLAIDVLRSARVRRETYTGSWLPEPLVEDDAAAQVEDEEAVSLAFLVLLERLDPDERAVLVLRESFDYAFADIAEILGISDGQRAPDPQPRPPPRSTTSARASTPTRASAARSRRASSPPPATATWRGSSPMLAPDAVLVGDGGGKARSMPAPMLGAARVARALVGFYGLGERVGRHASSRCSSTASPASARRARRPAGQRRRRSTSRTARSAALHSMLNPDKLGHLGPLSDLGLRPVRATPPR